MFAIDHDRFSQILQSIQEVCVKRHLSLATAESCTGGLLAALLTHQSGSSAFYLGGVSTYANSAKTRLLHVETAMLESYGAVSAEVARKMAESTRELLGSDFALSITGIAGPGGGSPGKPVGTVFCGWSTADAAGAEGFVFSGTREEIRAASCYEALAIVYRLLGLI